MYFTLNKFETNYYVTIYKSECRVANSDGFVIWNEVCTDTSTMAEKPEDNIMLQIIEEDDEDKPNVMSENEEVEMVTIEDLPNTSS